MNHSFWMKLLVGCGVMSLVITGCNRKNTGQAARENAAMPLIPVHVQPVIRDQVQDFREFTGRTAAANSVEVRARVSGYLRQSPRRIAIGSTSNPPSYPSQIARDNSSSTNTRQVEVREGDFVHSGTLLFQIDPAPYEIALAQAEGDLTATQAQLERFRLDLNRAKELLDTRSISQADYDLAVANVSEAAGRIDTLRASIDRAKLDLEFTQVTAPIDGYLGRSLVTDGNLINADETILTTVVASKPIFVYFNVDERSLLDYRQRIRAGKVKSAREDEIKIRLGLVNEQGYPHEGVIDFVDNTTSADTGNTQIRGRFDNADGSLSPGLFARILSPFTESYEAVLVPTKALGMDQQGRYVMLSVDGKAVRQSVEVGEIHGDSTVIKLGLNGNEKVITSGLQRVRHGATIQEAQGEPD